MEAVCLSLESSKKKCAKCCILPQRYLLAVMACLGVILASISRNSILVILEYIVLEHKDGHVISPDQCNNTNKHHKHETEIKFKGYKNYNWGEEEQNQIQEIFYYGYVVGHLPGGYIGDMHGGKHVFGWTVLLSTFTNVIMPAIVKQTRSATSLTCLRFVVGIIQGALYPSLNSLLSSWTPARDRGKISGIAFSANMVGVALTSVLSVQIERMADWSHIFYWYTGITVLWFILWSFLCYSFPTNCSFLSENEKEYLEKELEGHVTYGKKKVPFCKILASVPLWTLVFMEIANDWVYFSIRQDIPEYLNHILDFDVKKSLLLAALPYGISGLFVILNGFTADFIINSHMLSVTMCRHIYATMGMMGPAIFIVAATFANCNTKLVIVMIALGLNLKASSYTGVRIITLDLAPNYSGIVMALVNGIGTLTGFIQPQIQKLIITHNSIYEWRLIFTIGLVISAMACLFFSIWGSAREQAWNNPEAEEEKEEDVDKDT